MDASTQTSIPVGCPYVVYLAWARYKQQLQQKPLRTKALTSACIASLSDVIAQRMIAKRYDWQRTVKMALYGLLWGGPSAHYWQEWLQRLFARKQGSLVPVQKVMVDQVTYGPLQNLIFMMFSAMALNGASVEETIQQMVRDFPSVQRQGWKVWPLAGIINYKFVPLECRVLFINLVALCWGTFLIVRSRGGTGGKPG
eukprot:jgi/Chrzof1/12115/Cz06g21270.t1